MEVAISEPLARIIANLARESGKDIDSFLADLLSEKVDPENRIKIYLALYKKFVKEAEELEGRGDLTQASEKYWGAIASLLNIVSEVKGKPHYTHRDYWELMNIIIDETKDEELTELFALAEKLHANFYHNFIPKHQFVIYSKRIKKLIRKLIEYLKKHNIDIED